MNGNFQQCDLVFCASAPYPLPTICCDQSSADCQAKYQQCMVGTFGSYTLCSTTYCSSEYTRSPDASSPDPTRGVEKPTPEPTRVVEKPTPEPTRVVERPTPEPTRVVERPTPSSDFTKLPDIPTSACCDRESDICKMMHRSCIASGGIMCDLLYCDRSPLPSFSSRPTRKPKPSPRFSAFPSPKFLRAIPSILPKEIKSTIQLLAINRKEIENITKIKEIQVRISCSLRMPLDNIKIKNITFIDQIGIRNIIKFNEIDIDNTDIPIIDCLLPGLRRLQTASNNVVVDYVVIDPTPELLAYDPVDLIQASSNTQTSSPSKSGEEVSIVGAVIGSVFGTLAIVAIVVVASIYSKSKTKTPITRQSIRVVVVENSNPLNFDPQTNNAQKVAFRPIGSRV